MYKIAKDYGENIQITTQEMEVSYDERKALCARRDITLNGQPATISGAMMKFAVVRSMNFEGEWNWSAVKRIVAKGGKFS